jgi:DUF1365 family protein
MNSCLYECRVRHRRFVPRDHRFEYGIFLFALDLDELESLPGRLGLFSLRRPNVYRFRDADYLPTAEPVHRPTAPGPAGSGPLKERVVRALAARGIDLSGGRVVLVTLPRILGYLFNPVSFYFCYGKDGAPAAALAEVTNTFREMKPYFLGRPADGRFRCRLPKDFYVSPFSDLDIAFDFDLRPPGERLAARIDDYAGAGRTLASTLLGERRELTAARLAWWTVKYPMLTLRIIALIHWHALRLWLKRVPWFAKASRPGLQRDLYRPHASIAPARETP